MAHPLQWSGVTVPCSIGNTTRVLQRPDKYCRVRYVMYERTDETNERAYHGGVWVSLDNGIANITTHHPPAWRGKAHDSFEVLGGTASPHPLRLLLEQPWMPLFAGFVVCAICQAGKPVSTVRSVLGCSSFPPSIFSNFLSFFNLCPPCCIHFAAVSPFSVVVPSCLRLDKPPSSLTLRRAWKGIRSQCVTPPALLGPPSRPVKVALMFERFFFLLPFFSARVGM